MYSSPAKSRPPPALLEIPVNTLKVSPNRSQTKERLESYQSPERPASPSERVHSLTALHNRLDSAEKRRERNLRQQQHSPQQRAERFSMNKFELQNEKRAASAKLEQRMANAEAKRKELQDLKVKKAGGRYFRAKELSSAEKAKKATLRVTTVSKLQLQQETAKQRRKQHLDQKRQAAQKFNRRVDNAKIDHENKLKQKRAAINQKLDDATARRNVSDVAVLRSAYASAQHSKTGTVIEIPTEAKAPSPVSKQNRVVARLNSYPSPAEKRAASAETLDRRMQEAEHRREQRQLERMHSPKSKERTERFNIKRIQLMGGKKHAAAAGGLKRANADRNRQKIQESKVKKAQQRVSRAKAVAAAKKEQEATEVGQRKAAIDQQLLAAQERREEFLAQKRSVAEKANLQVQSVNSEQNALLREKRMALEQKQKDAAARRNTAESHKARHTPSKLRPGSPTAVNPSREGGSGAFFGRQPLYQQLAAPPAAPMHTFPTMVNAQDVHLAAFGRSLLQNLWT